MSDQDQDSTAFNVVERRTGSQDHLDASVDKEILESTDAVESAVPNPDSSVDSEEPNPESEESDNDFDERNLPDPTFLLSMATMQMDSRALLQALIPIFDSYAWRSMGFIADPKTGETNKDMASAQLAIDAVQFLLE